MGIEQVAAQSALTAIEPVAARRRRLTAVMLADVVGYSRMMSRSEDETHDRFAGHSRELIDPTINKYGGRLVRSMGDGLLAEFVSAVDAVRCALDIQRGLAARQANEPDPMQLRIGINTGDVLVDQRDIYGNSVNIAARLEALASPGTVCVSQSIYDQTRAQPEFFFADRGTRRVKNIPYPVHVYEVAYERIRVTLLTWLVAHWVRLAAIASIGAIAIAWIASVLILREQHQVVARTNTIIVLPFKNVNGNAADDYLADAITDELTTELSQLRRAWVISSGTAFTYKDKPNDARQIGRELHVRYALGGSVRRAGPIVQVKAQLVDTESGTNLWANSFAYETSSLLDLQDNLMGQIATSLNDEVTRAGIRHEVGTLAADHNPLDERMRAMAASTGFPTAEKSLETRQHAEAGLKADPDNARLLGLLAAWLTSDVLNGWNGAGNAEVERAEAAAKKAIGLDHNTPLAHHALGWVHRLRGNHQAALDAFNEAIKIDPNFASAYAQAANEMVFLGNAKGATQLAEKAIELSPKDPSIGVFLWVKGRAYFTIRDYEKAAEALQESARVRPNLWFTHAWLVAAYALTDRDAKAQQALDAFKQRHSARSDLDWITRYYKEDQYQNPTVQEALAELLNGLRKAGLK
jgi:class 3 adenylate cyclase/TolB-like protein/Flp pilus assembly protein TadD